MSPGVSMGKGKEGEGGWSRHPDATKRQTKHESELK